MEVKILGVHADPTEDGVDAVLMLGDPPEESAAGGTHGRAVLQLL